MNDDHFNALNKVKSPDHVNQRVFAAAENTQRNRLNAKRHQWQLGASFAVGALVSALVVFTLPFNQSVDPMSTADNVQRPTIEVQHIRFRGEHSANSQVIDLTSLTDEELKELAIELIMTGQPEQAQQVLIWLSGKP